MAKKAKTTTDKTTKKTTKKITKKTTKKTTKSVEQTMMGKMVGPFSVLNSAGKTFTEKDLKGHKTVLYFYPKDDTPGCTIEAQQFSDLKSSFDKLNTVILGISKDSSITHERFINKFGFKNDLLSDEKEKLCKLFDVIKMKNMYGRKYLGIERSTFVLDENLQVIKEMRKISPNGHAQDVLDFVKSL